MVLSVGLIRNIIIIPITNTIIVIIVIIVIIIVVIIIFIINIIIMIHNVNTCQIGLKFVEKLVFGFRNL